MAITFHPKVGQILMCDFSAGFKAPEMVKKRPVLVLTSGIAGRSNLVTVLALSTTRPTIVMPFHYPLSKNSMPQIGKFQQDETWVKGDMIYTVGFHRLDLIKLGTKDRQTGRRLYFKQVLGRDQMKKIYTCTLHGLNLGFLSEHL